MPLVILTARELAARFSVSYETVLMWVHRGTIPVIRDGRNRMRFNLDAVLRAFRPDAFAAFTRDEDARNAAARAALHADTAPGGDGS